MNKLSILFLVLVLLITYSLNINILPFTSPYQTYPSPKTQAVPNPLPIKISKNDPLPPSLSNSTLSHYGISTHDISFSNLQPYSQTIDVGLYHLNSSLIDIYSIYQEILQTISPQLQKIDPNYIVIQSKFKLDPSTLTLFIVYSLNGQKIMQSIYIKFPNTSIYQQLSTQIKTPTISTPIPLSFQLTYTPKYTIPTSNTELMTSIAGPSDPNIVSFLTASTANTLNTALIDKIMKYLIKTQNITQDFNILLINQIQYAIRFVLQLSDETLYQAIITSSNHSPQLLHWKHIFSISDISPSIFSTFYQISPDEDLKKILSQAFDNTQTIKYLKDIILTEKKITFDGIYYRIILQSQTGNRYNIILYYIPNKNYTQIYKYQLIHNGYNSKYQIPLTTIPQNDQLFIIAKQHLFKKYANILQNTKISYAATYQKYPNKFYRFVLEGINGKYQAIQTVNQQTLTSKISRWQKLQSGYIPLNLKLLTTLPQYNSLQSSLSNYISAKFGLITQPMYLQLKKVPDIAIFYKFTFDHPFPFTLTLQQQYTDHTLTVKGMEAIPVAPDNQFYNDRLFKGYSSLNLNQLQYDDDYQTFSTLLSTHLSPNSPDIQCLSAFRKQTPNGISYKVIYSINTQLYLAQFIYKFSQSQHQLISFQQYQQNIQPGDYRWMCQTINEHSKTCSLCNQDYLLTSGRCYATINNCTFQIASTCKVCNAGYVRVSRGCEKSQIIDLPDQSTLSDASDTSDITTDMTTPTPSRRLLAAPQTSATTTSFPSIFTPISSTLTQTSQSVPFTVSASLFSSPLNIAQIATKDIHCLLYKGLTCTQCMYRYYLSNGLCQKVQDQCTIFNELTGVCSNCSSGYYLNKNAICTQLEPLCGQADSTGYCLRCYNTYILISGKCYAQSNLNITSNSRPPSDSLCIEWTQNTCTKCQYGTYMSKKIGLCTIQDPFCQQFDQNLEVCLICQRGFSNVGASQCQKTS